MRSAALASVVLLFTVGACHAQMKEWQARYDKLSRTFATRDFPAFQSMIAKNYVWVDPNGKRLNRAQAMESFKTIFAARSITGGEKVTSVKKVGNKVEIGYDAHWVVVFEGKKPQRIHEMGIDTWQKIGGRWLCVKTVDRAFDESEG